MRVDIYVIGFSVTLTGLVALALLHRRLRREHRELTRHSTRTKAELAARLETEENLVRRFRTKVEALKGAVERGAIECVYQPVVDLSTGAILGMEALSRFSDGRAPEVWFKEAAELDITCQLEMAAIDHAFKHLDGTHEGFLAVNVSPCTIAYPSFLSLLMSPEVQADRVVVEVTEHAVVENYETVRSIVGKLKRLGVRIAVDDVGAGFSTFRHVLQLHPDIVKLDRSLISGIDQDPVRLSLVASLVKVAERMDASVVAEGIEVDGEVNALWSLGVEMGQGYLFCRPRQLPIEDLSWRPSRKIVVEDPIDSESAPRNEMRSERSIR